MSPEQKALLTAAFEALGPERVTRGLQATGHSWIDCFLTIATYGEPGAFVRALKNRSRRTGANDVASSVIGVPLGVVDELVGLWDNEERRFLAAHEPLVIVDAREPSAFAARHAPGARLIAYEQAAGRVLKALEKGEHMVSCATPARWATSWGGSLWRTAPRPWLALQFESPSRLAHDLVERLQGVAVPVVAVRGDALPIGAVAEQTELLGEVLASGAPADLRENPLVHLCPTLDLGHRSLPEVATRASALSVRALS